MADLRRDFLFQDPKTPADVRSANALEFIAHYLDRIDHNLERLAASAQNVVGSTEAIRIELVGIAEFVKRLKP